LPSRDIVLADRYGADYGVRIGDDLDVYTTERVVHPAVWPALANAVFAADLVRGPWIHLRSSIRHHGLAAAGAVATVHATVIDRFQRRSGERAIVDVVIEVDGSLVVTIARGHHRPPLSRLSGGTLDSAPRGSGYGPDVTDVEVAAMFTPDRRSSCSRLFGWHLLGHDEARGCSSPPSGPFRSDSDAP
jgi:hypothetical protein